MLVFKLISRIFLLLIWTSPFAQAQEQELNLDELKTEAPAPYKIKAQDFKIMGRLDLTWEYGNPTPSTSPDGKLRNTLENNHQFIFLKIKASEKSHIMAEVVNKTFFYAEYADGWGDVQLGNILVPFGDNRRYHLFYGGIQGYGADGVMFANVWSEPGFNFNWKTSLGSLDTYVVNSISASGATADPNFKTEANTSHQAGGLRLTKEVASGWTTVLSVYSGEYWPGKGLHILGFDIYSDYGTALLGKNFRGALGMAQATVLQSSPSNGQSFSKTGDFVELATRLLGPG
ncbi:MAG: hypothetical protein ACK5V3_16905, partial [Bdellovibrionales bacterium]